MSTSAVQARTVTARPVAERVGRYGVWELALEVANPVADNPFTEVTVRGTFTPPKEGPFAADGFCDAADGTRFKIRCCPEQVGEYTYRVEYRDPAGQEVFTGRFLSEPSDHPGPVVACPKHPHHFLYAGSGQHFYHLGYTAYHLLDVTNSEAQIRRALDTWAEWGFTKVRFLLAGYPRDTDTRPTGPSGQGGLEQWKMPNYGAPPGEVNPLPAWQGEPHHYDFTRFNVEYWQKVERVVAYMQEKGLVATCIFTIEKQGLPKEYGALTEHEKRFYRYAIARLAAFSNVWWDLGNEHNEYRGTDWGNEMGRLVKEWDPYDRLTSAHAYAEWLYGDADWTDFIITQQYGTPPQVNAWALKYRPLNKPYVNEEYGYEGTVDKPGHGHHVEWVRKCHWAIALAGGYATYGDWFDGAFYTGHLGRGRAPAQLRHLRAFFEELPYWELEPHNDLVSEENFCLAKPGEVYVVYLPNGGTVTVNLTDAAGQFSAQWFDPRTGEEGQVQPVRGGAERPFTAPSEADWVLLLARGGR